MAGILFSLLAGIAVSLQGVFNTRLSEKAGFWITNTWVHGTGLVVSLIIFLILRDGSFGKLLSAGKLYWFGGVIGVIIIYSISKGIGLLGAAYAVAIIFTMQIIVTFLVDHFGWFGMPKVPFSYNKLAGILVMIGGVVLYKIK